MWKKLAALPPEKNPHADEAALQATLSKRFLPVPPEEREAHLERVAAELREHAESRTGEWRRKALDALAWACFRLGRVDEAVSALETVARENEGTRFAALARSNAESIRAWGAHKPGNPAIPFSGVTVSGERIELSQFKGSVVLLDFWATWWGPSLEELPAIKSLHDSLAGKGLVVLGVTTDEDPDKLRRFLRDEDITWRQLLDSEQEKSVVELYQVKGIPCAFLIDRDGTVRERGLRGERLEFAVRMLVGRQASSPTAESEKPAVQP